MPAPGSTTDSGLDPITPGDGLPEPAVQAWEAYHQGLVRHPVLAEFPLRSYRQRARRLLGLDDDGSAEPAPTGSVLAYTEQFLLDANSVDRTMGRDLKDELGDTGLTLFTVWLGVTEAETRLEILFGGASPVSAPELPSGVRSAGSTPRTVDPREHPWPDDAGAPQPSVQELLERIAPDVAVLRGAIGPAIGSSLPRRAYELTRLVSANSVVCRYCQNVRITGDGGDPLLAESEVDDLVLGGADPDRDEERLALAAARAFHAVPTPPEAGLTQELLSETAAVQADLAVTLLRNPAGSKAMIALGLVPDSTPLTLL